MFRDLESLFLARTGEVVAVASGEEALDCVRDVQPDVALVDLELPGVSGEAVCRAFKADPDLRRMPVILVTNGERPEDRARAVRAGADDVIAKPLCRMALIQAVSRQLRPAALRGLARVKVAAQVRIGAGEGEALGIARNLSRGGLFVEAERSAPRETEVQLRFALPNFEIPLTPTAQVIWSRDRTLDAPMGMGLQFLAIDRESARRIDDFVYERAPVRQGRPPKVATR